MLNKAQVIGNLGKDPETRYFQDGNAVTNISVATTEKWKDKSTGEAKEKTEWHKISFRGRLAEVAAEYLKQGSKVFIEGKLTTRKWQDQSGNDRFMTEIIASQLVMLGGNEGDYRKKQSSAPASNNQGATMSDEDIPF